LGILGLGLLFVGVTNDFGLEFAIASGCITVVIISIIKTSPVKNYRADSLKATEQVLMLYS